MPSTSCPTRIDLTTYLSGSLSEEQIEAVAAHVEECRSCQAILPTLEDSHDTLGPRLRQRTETDISLPDSPLRELLERAKVIALEMYGIGTASTLTSNPGRPPASTVTQLDQYRLLEKIGQGGMGSVYKALHLRLEKIVALKVLTPDRTGNTEALARFQREIRAAGKLNHPNIVTATDAREADGVFFLVMELMEGIDLAKLVKRLGRLPVAEACELIRQAAEGLQHVHEHGLVHRDIKPSNLILCNDGRLKVLDLGLARLRDDPTTEGELTASGQVMGTIDYMAPEQGTDAKSVDIRADIYSLGCTMFHLLAGQTPFHEHSHPASKLLAHMTQPAPAIRTLRPEIPEALSAILDRMLAKNPNERPATPVEVARALRPLAAGSDLLALLASVNVVPVRRDIAAAEASSIHQFSTVHSDDRHVQEKQPGKLINEGKIMPAIAAPPPIDKNEKQLSLTSIIPLTLMTGAAFLVVVLLLIKYGPSSQLAKQEENAASAKQSEKAPPAKEPDKTPPAKEPDKTPPAKEPDKTPPAKEPDKTSPPTKEEADALAAKGVHFLKTYCYRCHGVDFKVPGMNVMDRATLTPPRGKDESPYLTLGKPNESQLWQRAGIEGDMPPSKTKPSEAEKETFKQWIAIGAPYPGRPSRPFQSEKDMLTAIRDQLKNMNMKDRKFQRFFTLTHLFNNNKHVSADEMRLYRAALAKMVNSLSWKQRLVVPKAVDKEGTVFQVDLRDLGWDEHALWKEVLKAYPYGLTHTGSSDEGLRALAQEVAEMAGNELPYLRADWLIATASRPPLYHTLLQLPKHAEELERMLKVDVRQDFLHNKLARAAFLTSGVSRQNRLVDRHDAVYGSYWKSYDFKTNEGQGNLTKYPLGPPFPGNLFPKQTFEHAGGELIFNLPNGLQGYLLVDEKDRRIDIGPVDVVNDSRQTSGTPQIVNGLSCMACHKHGVVRFKDDIRNGTSVAGDALVKVQELYRKKDDMDLLLTRDEDRFLRALEESAGPFLKAEEDKDKNIRDFPEPVGAIARLYVKDLNLEETAFELGIEPKDLETALKHNPKLRELGLGPLREGGSIKRSTWSSQDGLISPFQNVAREMGLGTPLVSS